MIAQVSSAAQTEMPLGRIDGGTYRVGRNAAVWKTRAENSHIIDLSFRQRTYKVTKESRGPQGHGRLFVNGFRQPDGKLLQGRELLELIRKIDRFHGKLIKRQLDRIETTMHVRFDQIEKSIERTKWRRLRGKGKLCTIPITPTWTQERYVPKSALGGFSRVPLPVIRASQGMAAGEYRLLQAILFCAQGSGLLTAGKKKLARLGAVAETHVKEFLRSLHNRQLIRPTGRTLKFGTREYEVLTHPWLTSAEEAELQVEPPTGGQIMPLAGGQIVNEGGQGRREGGTTLVPLKTSTSKSKNKTSKKTEAELPALEAEEKLLEEISQTLGWRELVSNGGIWRTWMRKGPDHVRAIRNTLEDFRLRADNYQNPIRNVGKWANDQYHRNFAKIQNAAAREISK